jgi:hypothetical protein
MDGISVHVVDDNQNALVINDGNVLDIAEGLREGNESREAVLLGCFRREDRSTRMNG